MRAMNGCAECLKPPRESARLTAALPRLQPTLRDQDRPAPAGVCGAATPSAKRPVQTHTPSPPAPKPPGARPGPPGAGRHACDARPAARVIEIPPVGGARGPACDTLVADQGTDRRAVIESPPVQAARVRSRRPKPDGPRDRRPLHPRAPAVRPQGRSGHQRLATATTRHALQGLP